MIRQPDRPTPCRAVSALLATALLTTGCTTLDPYTGEERTARATQGAAIGAAVGAVIGLISGDDTVERRQRALLLAGVGALAGGLVGNYMDQQQEALRQELAGTGVSVVRNGDQITLNMPGNITFTTDSYQLEPGFPTVLDSVAKVLARFEKTVVEVVGHTDSTGSEAYNDLLSRNRAQTVSDYLGRAGVLQQRMIVIGAGEHYPVADNADPRGRSLNRRVELTLVPLTAVGPA